MIETSKTRQSPFGRDSGLTLVELLVALTIFTFVVSISAYMFGFVLNLSAHSEAEYADDTQNLSLLRDSIASMFYYVGDRSEGRDIHQSLYELFYGSADEMEYVSSQPMHGGGVLTLTRLYHQDGALWIIETPLYDKRYDYRSPQTAGRDVDATLVIDGVDSVSFRYLTDNAWKVKLSDEIPRLVEMKLKVHEEVYAHYIGIGSDFTQKIGRAQTRIDMYKGY
jgi:prepilin-type N-terminal cleavage/methylation domain-containing protein